MAKIKKEDLEHFSNDEIRSFIPLTNWRDLPEPMYSYIKKAYDEKRYVWNEITRCDNLFDIIIVDRFKRGEIK